MRGAIRLLDDGQAERDRRLRLEVDPSAVVALPANPDLDDVAFRPVFVELNDPASFVLRRGAEVVDDPLHPRVRVVDRRQEVVERRDVMVHDGAFSEERVNQVSHVLPPDHQSVRFRNACRAAHPNHADDSPLADGPFDLLEHLDHRIALPDLRELVPRDLQRLQNAIRLFLRDEPMLWNELMLQYVKPQGRSSLGDRFAPGMSRAREPYGPAGTFGASARSAGPVRTPDHPVSSRSPVREAAKSRMLFLGTVPSPSYLAELRALRLAAATCDRSPNRALVLKFAVIEDVSRDR